MKIPRQMPWWRYTWNEWMDERVSERLLPELFGGLLNGDFCCERVWIWCRLSGKVWRTLYFCNDWRFTCKMNFWVGRDIANLNFVFWLSMWGRDVMELNHELRIICKFLKRTQVYMSFENVQQAKSVVWTCIDVFVD